MLYAIIPLGAESTHIVKLEKKLHELSNGGDNLTQTPRKLNSMPPKFIFLAMRAHRKNYAKQSDTVKMPKTS